jgi:hypothetical protein
MASSVAKLLDPRQGKTAFVSRLQALATKQGWRQQLERFSFSGWEKARAVPMRSGQTQYVVVLLKSWTHSVPENDLQTVILLDCRGSFLDQLACEIDPAPAKRGEFHTVIPEKPEADGAQLVIRLDHESARGNFEHHIYYGVHKTPFYWGHDNLPENQPTKWDCKGLCRIAIADGKLKVLFPSEEDKKWKAAP